MKTRKEKIREFLLAAANQRMQLIFMRKSYNGCTIEEAEKAKAFLLMPYQEDVFWNWIRQNQNIIYKVLTPTMRKKYELLIKK